MEMPTADDAIPNYLQVVETNSLMETLDDVIPLQVVDANLMEILDDAISDFSHVVEESNSVEPNTISNSLEKVETNNTEESSPDSLAPPAKKKKKENFHWVLRKRARKYLGMKGHELRSILINGSFKFCQQYNLLATSAICSCGTNMNLSPLKQTSDGIVWRCGKGHKNSVTVRKGSWFENSRNSLSESLWIIYMWVHEYSYVSMLHESDVSNQALQDWCNNCRDACQPILKTKTDPIGGSDKVVEIFEAKFKDTQDSKKKKGKDGSEQWIFFAIERFSTKSVYLSVPDKNTQTLFDIFDVYILPESKVYSHIWNIYIDLDEDSFDYLTKEKLLTFHDCNTTSDIKTFKRFQNVADKPHPRLNSWDKNEFCEFMYRKTLFFAPDAYLAFLKDIALVYSPEGGVIRKEQPIPKTEKKDCE